MNTTETASLPLVIHSDGGDGVTDLLSTESERIQRALVAHGAVLLRGFDIGGVDGFDAVVRALSGSPLTYTEASSPRSAIKGQVYTSTEYPHDEEIFLHNETSYRASWPLKLYFHCVEPPATQGATPLADVREVHDAIDPAVREEFASRKWMLVRNFHPDFGMSWQHVFGTDDPADVESYCAGNGIRFEWVGEDGLRTKAVREPIHYRPGSDRPSWFNHATFFHVSTLAEEVAEGLLEMFGTDGLPANSYYGDGGEIPADVVAHLRTAYRGAATRFDYERDDVLIVDNMTAAHGREPFTGPRKIEVAMAEPYPTGQQEQ